MNVRVYLSTLAAGSVLLLVVLLAAEEELWDTYGQLESARAGPEWEFPSDGRLQGAGSQQRARKRVHAYLELTVWLWCVHCE